MLRLTFRINRSQMFITKFLSSGPIVKIIFYLAVCLTSLSAFAAHSLQGASIRWDVAKSLTSPDGKWRIEVQGSPTLENDEAPVLLKNVKTGRFAKIFDLNREASVIWGPDGKVLILNAPGAGHEQVLLIDPVNLYSVSRLSFDAIDRRLKSLIEKRIGRDKEVAFYIPTAASWRDNRLTLTVGGTAAPKASGSTVAYCYIFTIDTKKQRIEQVFDDSRNADNGTTKRCQLFP